MARLAGVDIPREKRVEVALTYIYGVGRTRALKTLVDTQISGDIRVKDLTDDQLVVFGKELSEEVKATEAQQAEEAEAQRQMAEAQPATEPA
jgi:small subunit ribosomal protein S13